MFENFWGNRAVTESLEQMIGGQRLSGTLLFSGREGMSKATLARRMAARLLGDAELIEKDDLALSDNLETIAAREKWTAEKRNEDPLQLATHPDFVTFAPDGPLRQISIPQTRLLKEAAQYLPHKGARRVFLIDHVDRANDQEGSRAISAAQGRPARVPDRPRGPRQRSGGQLPAQDARGATGPFDPHHDGGKRLRSAAHHPLARRAVLLRAAGCRGNARLCAGARPRSARAPHGARGRQSGHRHVARSGGLR